MNIREYRRMFLRIRPYSTTGGGVQRSWGDENGTKLENEVGLQAAYRSEWKSAGGVSSADKSPNSSRRTMRGGVATGRSNVSD
jgi:hypothetical protein